MRNCIMIALFFCAAQAAAAESWFDYPASTQLKTMNQAITRFEVKADLLLPPATTGLTIVKTGSDDDDGYSETLCTLSYAQSPDYRRLVASTKLAVTMVQAVGDTDASDERSRAKVRVGLESAGGFQALLECSYHYSWWSNEDSDSGSSNDQSPSTIATWFRVQRKETIISPP